MIRVLQFADIINRYDFIDTIVQYADPEKFEIHVCVRSEEHNIATPVFKDTVRYQLLKGKGKKKLFATAWKLSRFLKKWNIDILHAHHFDQAIIGFLATKFYSKTKLVIGRHYSDALYRLPPGIKRKLLLKIEQKINRIASRIIVPSKYIYEILTQKQHIDSNKIDVILYGFDPKKYQVLSFDSIEAVRKEFAMENRFVVGNFSRLHEEKGHKYLIEAIRKVKDTIPELLVLIVGEGNERKNIEELVRKYELQNVVKLVGWRKDAMIIMKAVDIIVQTTLQEAFSQVMCEALWMEKPLVMTNVSGAVDIIQNEINGLIVSKANVQAIADAIDVLYQKPQLRTMLGNNGKKFIEQQLSISTVIKLYETSYSKTMGVKQS
jgi:glycosyltransferase involved in cell wall biosynthesis